MTLTGRWENRKTGEGIWNPFAAVDANIAGLDQRLKHPESQNLFEFDTLVRHFTKLTNIRATVVALLHNFATQTYYEKAFSDVSESIFDSYRAGVDARIAEVAGGVLEKIDSAYRRLAEGDVEAISHALTTCRRIIKAFADAVFPPTNETRKIDTKSVRLGPSEFKNRLNAYIDERTDSKSRKKRLRQTLENLHDRVSAGVHNDVTVDEARSLFLQTYLFLGEVLTLKKPEVEAEEETT
jgi:hypothetical protein